MVSQLDQPVLKLLNYCSVCFHFIMYGRSIIYNLAHLLHRLINYTFKTRTNNHDWLKALLLYLNFLTRLLHDPVQQVIQVYNTFAKPPNSQNETSPAWVRAVMETRANAIPLFVSTFRWFWSLNFEKSKSHMTHRIQNRESIITRILEAIWFLGILQNRAFKIG